MEYSLVFLGERNKKKILENISSLSLIPGSYQVIFLTNTAPKNEELYKVNNRIIFKTIVFDLSANSDEMFETVIQTERLGTVILFKESYVNINFSEINRMLEKNSNGSMLVISKQNKNENFFTKIINSIKAFFTRLFLGVKLFDGEADIIILDRILVSTMPEMPGKSAILTKVNAWAGVEPKYTKIDQQPKAKTKKFSAKSFVPLIIISAILLGFIVGDILFGVLNLNLSFLALFAYIIVEIAVLVIFLYSLTRTLFKLKFGNIMQTRKTNITSVIDNFDE